MTIMALTRGIWSNDYFAMDESIKKHKEKNDLFCFLVCQERRIEDTLFSGESKNIEYKVTLLDKSEKYMKTIVAFANTCLLYTSGMFRNMLDYKLSWKGKELVQIDRFFPSSKKCSKCGKIKKELKLSERVYRCTCGNEMDRDRNAAINIREEARRMLTA